MPSLNDIRLFARHHLKRRVYDHPAQDTEMGVVGVGYEPAAFAREVRAFGDRFDVRTEAELPHGDARYPLLSVRSRTPAPRARVLVLSGVHGNEQAGIVSVPPLLERFHAARARYDAAGLALTVLTPVNPVGAACFSRYNAAGFDINRDFVRFETEEARVVRRTFEAAPPDFVVALHEGPQDASFVFANEHVTRDLAERVLAALAAGGTALAEKDYFGRTLRPAGLAASSAPQRALIRLWAAALGMRATNGWCASRGVPELTLESAWRSQDRAARLRAHVDLVLAVCDELAARTAG